jgi:hypothetical protein
MKKKLRKNTKIKILISLKKMLNIIILNQKNGDQSHHSTQLQEEKYIVGQPHSKSEKPSPQSNETLATNHIKEVRDTSNLEQSYSLDSSERSSKNQSIVKSLQYGFSESDIVPQKYQQDFLTLDGVDNLDTPLIEDIELSLHPQSNFQTKKSLKNLLQLIIMHLIF